MNDMQRTALTTVNFSKSWFSVQAGIKNQKLHGNAFQKRKIIQYLTVTNMLMSEVRFKAIFSK